MRNPKTNNVIKYAIVDAVLIFITIFVFRIEIAHYGRIADFYFYDFVCFSLFLHILLLSFLLLELELILLLTCATGCLHV